MDLLQPFVSREGAEKERTQQRPTQTAKTQQSNPSNPSLALTKQESSLLSDELNERGAAVTATDIGERLDQIVDSLKDSSRRAEKLAVQLADNLRGTSREAEALGQDAADVSREADHLRRDTSDVNQQPEDQRSSSTESQGAGQDRARELLRLSERLRSSGRKNRLVRKSVFESLRELTTQLGGKIQQLTQGIKGNQQETEQQQVQRPELAGPSDSHQAPGTPLEDRTDSSRQQSDYLAVNQNLSDQRWATQSNQWQSQQEREPVKQTEYVKLTPEFDPQLNNVWYQGLAEQAKEDLTHTEYLSPEEVDTRVAMYGIMMQISQQKILDWLGESDRVQHWRQLQRQGLISQSERETKVNTYTQEIYDLARGLLNHEQKAQSKYQRLQQRPAVVSTVRTLLRDLGEPTEKQLVTFSGSRYKLLGTKNLQNVAIFDKDRQEIILRLKDGVLEGFLSKEELECFQNLQRQLDKDLTRNQPSPSQISQQQKERDRGFELG